MVEHFPDNEKEENPRPIGDDIEDVVDEIRQRSEASDLDKARLTLINLMRDVHANPNDVADAKLRVMELEQEAKDD
jgi:hypothetical protein